MPFIQCTIFAISEGRRSLLIMPSEAKITTEGSNSQFTLFLTPY